MASSFTTNKTLEKPGNGDYVDTWNVPVNSDLDVIDQAFGGTTSINVTAVSGTISLSASQYRSLVLAFSGTLTANVTYQVPAGVGGQWILSNAATGAFTITISSGGGGATVNAASGVSRTVYSDGTNIKYADNIVTTAGSNTQVIYNSAGALSGSANLTFNGTTLTANTLDVTNTIVAGGDITAYSDAALKENISTIYGALDLVQRMRGVRFTRKIDGRPSVGVIAQEMENVVPEVVHDDASGMKSVAYQNLVGVLIEAVKELTRRVAVLEGRA
jgi:hypothetical protein